MNSTRWVGVKWTMAAIASAWAAVPVTVQTLMILMFIDYVLGVLRAVKSGEASYSAGIWGLVGKTATLLVVVTASRVLAPLHLPLDFGITVAGAYVINEAISIVRSASALGVWIPPVLRAALARAKKAKARGAASGS